MSRAKRQVIGIFQFNLKIRNDIIHYIKAWRKISWQKRRETGMRTNKRQTRRKKIFQHSTRRLIEIKLILASHNHRAFLRVPHRTRRQKKYILNLRKHFLSHALRRREMNSLEVLNALHHLSVRHAGVYPADRLSRVWTRSTAIVVNTDDHNRSVAFYHRWTRNRKHISIAMDCRS